MGSEDETRKLLRIREDLGRRMAHLQTELEDLQKAIAEIDRNIVRQGFRQPTPAKTRPEPIDEAVGDDDQSSIKSKGGMTLGTLRLDGEEIVFEPVSGLVFNTSIPPFQSFLVDRVFENMRAADEERATRGEATLDEVLSYEVVTEGDRILRIIVRNFGGERRLREIRSSLRWAFDKMYDKLRQS